MLQDMTVEHAQTLVTLYGFDAYLLIGFEVDRVFESAVRGFRTLATVDVFED